MNRHIHDYMYHGENRKDQFFEGWYFKHVSVDNNFSFALIPGISKNRDDPHAFFQLIMTPSMIVKYFRFDSHDFTTNEKPFFVKIKNNTFSFEKVHVQLKEGGFSFSANINYRRLTPINQSFIFPNIMGPFSYLPKIECNHGVISMNHGFSGELRVNDNLYHFHNEKGYIEKDWGTSFPKKYVWLQCNHFKDNTLSMMGSIALIPYLTMSFEGIIFNIVFNNKEYRFATYNFSTFKLEKIDENTRKIVLKKGKYRCEVTATITKVASLKSPKFGKMSELIKEGLEGEISLTLYKDNQLIVSSKGNHAGVEFVGY